ncbi:protein of unknown function [Latilactobacillus sakei]|uniref:helix-turn-helix domain-containing protein n=1 Tax=Latilactobacillus sakei TaxID=1599 RepID=UPI000C6F26FD|nr:helix-turn-helix domain-containing protein [Latilactobacillus sakei]SON68022.1 protein of unknown function [Latilactobacillus sakei]
MGFTVITPKKITGSKTKEHRSKQRQNVTVEWASPNEVAEHFGVSNTTIWRWRTKKNKPLPSYKNNGIVRFDLIECDEWYRGGFK